MKNIKLRKFGRILLAFVSTGFLAILIWILVDCFTTKSTATDKIITYNIKDNIDYVVTLKDNQFFTSEEANKSNSYITSLIDTLQVSFDYDLVGSSFFSSDYDYEIVLHLTSFNNGKKIWNYEESVLSQVNDSSEDVMKLDIDDTVNIDFSHLYAKAMEFNNLTGYDVNLKIDVKVNTNLKVNNYSDGIKDSQVLSLSVPMTDKVVSIKKSKGNNLDKKVLAQYEVNEKFNTYLFVLSGLLTLSLLPVAIMSYISLFNLTNLDDYNRKLKMLKKKYSYLIKEIEGEPKFKGKEIIEVISCRDLVDICNEKDLVINVYERIKGRECWFYVEDKKELYLYILRLDYREIDMTDKSMVINLGSQETEKKKGKKSK